MATNTDHLKRCLLTLERSLEALRGAEPESIDYEVYRNATVKGFELVLEVSGKLVRKTLAPYFPTARAVDDLGFKDLFRHAAKHGLMDIGETDRWMRYRDNRNDTAHDYGAGFAEETLVLLPDFISDARRLEERIRRATS